MKFDEIQRHFRWSYSPSDYELAHDDVHVWVADLEQGPRLTELAKTLSSDEVQRAGKFHFKRDRKNFIAARGLLRTILSIYSDVPAAELKFSYTNRGKPFLADAAGINFNLSHSGGLALYAITRDRDVGVDIEKIKPFSDMQAVADRSFLSEELSVMHFSGAREKEENFFRCWTRKEAQLKCSGEGFSDSTGSETFDGTLFELKPAKEFIGALAVRGHPCAVKTWQWRH